jgi:AraC-like DNA-binding protein
MSHWVRRVQLTASDKLFLAPEMSSMAAQISRVDGSAEIRSAAKLRRNGVYFSLSEQAYAVTEIERRNLMPLAADVTRMRGLADFGAAGHTVLNCRDLRAVVQAFNTFAPLLNLRHRISLQKVSHQKVETVYLLYLTPLPGIAPSVSDKLAPLDIVKLRRFLGDLGYRHVRADNFSTDCIIVDRLESQAPPAQSWRRTDVSFHLSRAKGELEALCSSHLPLAVHRLLMGSLDACPAFLSIAQKLGYSPRTLRRRLSELGTSFTEIMNEARLNKAVQLLDLNTLTTEDIAEKLGFSDDASFRRAFRRWTGTSPRRFVSVSPPPRTAKSDPPEERLLSSSMAIRFREHPGILEELSTPAMLEQRPQISDCVMI